MKIGKILLTASLTIASATIFTSCGMLRGAFGDSSKTSFGGGSQQIMLISSLGNTQNSGSIQSYSINSRTLEAEHTGTCDIASPTYMVLSSDKRNLFVTNEKTQNATLSVFNINALSGELTLLNQSYINGAEPTYVATRGDKAITANYGGGNISMINIKRDGSLGPADWQINLSSDVKSKPHAVVFSQDNRHFYVTDMAQDKVFHFKSHTNVPPITVSGDVLELPKGSGPRHLVFDSQNRFAYLICEYEPMVYVLSFNPNTGALSIVQKISTQGPGGKGGGHIALSNDGNYLYTSHRQNGDRIVTFKVNKTNGELTYVGYTPTGKHPRQFAISPDNQYMAVACRDSGVVELYKRNLTNGMLEKTPFSISVDKPMFVLWEKLESGIFSLSSN